MLRLANLGLILPPYQRKYVLNSHPKPRHRRTHCVWACTLPSIGVRLRAPHFFCPSYGVEMATVTRFPAGITKLENRNGEVSFLRRCKRKKNSRWVQRPVYGNIPHPRLPRNPLPLNLKMAMFSFNN